ncbi:MAG: cytochrome b/b6 domain-containing protein [Synechococcaceae cyanobacterium SM2_3_1]|nr:cytochrome b/b6 domain-containing protein [Synechococcaceae cyanobacterium SM2_3_1]
MASKPNQPYQPLLLRILHGLTGLFLIFAILTAFWTYNTYDGRWGRIPLPYYEDSESLHGTFALYTLLIFPFFMIYACHQGQKKLWQPDSLSKLLQVGRPIWWYTLSRISNTLSLLALTFALFSGKMMDEDWLPEGELDHFWYYAHLWSWVIMVSSVVWHILMNAKIGGLPFLLSIFRLRFRDHDHPSHWSHHISQWLTNFSWNSAIFWVQKNPLYSGLEITVLMSLVVAWMIPLLD